MVSYKAVALYTFWGVVCGGFAMATWINHLYVDRLWPFSATHWYAWDYLGVIGTALLAWVLAFMFALICADLVTE